MPVPRFSRCSGKTARRLWRGKRLSAKACDFLLPARELRRECDQLCASGRTVGAFNAGENLEDVLGARG